MTCKQIQDKIHNDYINRCSEGIAFGFAVCIAIQLMHEGKDFVSCETTTVEQYLPKICNRARQLADENPRNADERLNAEARQQLINELVAFESELGVGMPVSLLSADTDRVKSYVFESAKLPEVRGASIILDELNQETLVKKIFTGKDCQPPQECLIYSSGGGLLAIVPTCWAERTGKEIERLYLDRTKVATITTVTRPFHLCEYRFGLRADQFTFDQFQQQWANADEQRKRLMINYYGLEKETDDTKILWDKFCETKGFGELVRQMTADMKAAKHQKGFIPYFEAGHFIRACASCELRPAAIQDTIEDDEAYLCKVCYAKRDVGRKEKGRIVNKNLNDYFRNRACESSKYYFELPMRIAPPRDLKEIGDRSRPSGFVGIIYADGDSVGKTLERLPTPSEYKDFSRKMDNATQEAVFGTIVQRGIKPVSPSDKSKYEKGNRQRIQVVCPTDDEQLATRQAEKEHDHLKLYTHSFEVISVGGDDLVLIVPGHHAMWTALEICERFGREMQDEKITMSAGVVIASENYPVYYLFDLASQLQKSAKKESRNACEGAIDFMVMAAQNTLSSQITDYRSKFMERKIPEEGSDVREKLSLTARPYRLSKLRNLLEWIEKFKAEDYPTSQLYGLVQSLQQHARPHSTLRFLYQLYRHKETHTKLLQDFMTCWEIEQACAPWVKSQGELPFQEFFTYFVDLLEIYQFV